MSASGRTIIAFLAEVYAPTRLPRFVPSSKTYFPTAVEPTNWMALMPGCSTIALTASRPPYTTLNVPSGPPAACHSSAWSWVAPGVWEEGLRTTVLPHMRAIGTIHIGTMTGKLKGVIAATTPSGPRRVKASTLVATLGVIIPARWTGRPAAYSTVSRPRITSAKASG